MNAGIGKKECDGHKMEAGIGKKDATPGEKMRQQTFGIRVSR